MRLWLYSCTLGDNLIFCFHHQQQPPNMMGLLICAFHGVWQGGQKRRVTGEGNGACPSLGSTCLHWWHRALLISVQVSKCSPGMTAWHSQHPHSVTGAGSRSHCLPLMSMSLMEMEESEGHISIQIASILSAIHLAWLGWAAADFLQWLHLHIFTDLSLAWEGRNPVCAVRSGCPRHPSTGTLKHWEQIFCT